MAASPLLFRLYLLRTIPLAFVAGLRVRSFNDTTSVVSVPYSWRTQNPFRSTYFAAQAMAAEMSTGILGMYAVRCAPEKISMLVLSVEGQFTKKAAGRLFFTCSNGAEFREAIAACMADGEPRTVEAKSIGTLQDGTIAATFTVIWTFKVKRGK
ncbi:MAG: DUF4442 domain-containing protein [Chitinophagales bacterium]